MARAVGIDGRESPQIMLYRLLDETARNHPDKEAVVCGETNLSYGQLRERVAGLAAGFLSLGIQTKARIAIIEKNCHRYLEAYFAAARIGAILVPINHRLSLGEIEYILEDSQASALIGDRSILSQLKGRIGALPLLSHFIRTVNGDSPCDAGTEYDYEELAAGRPLPEGPPDLPGREQTAQIYYTSGTTGKPKGVILTHGNNLTHAEMAIEEFDLATGDRWLHVSPMFHLADAWAVWAITQAAGTHVMVPCFEPRMVLETMERQRITLSNYIPTMLNLLVKSDDAGRFDYSSLRVILSGGAPIATEVIRQVIRVFGCEYIQTYGLTESSPFLTASLLKEGMRALPFEERLKYMATTGRPFGRVGLKVIREDGTEVDRDGRDVGEIVAHGDTLSPGYWNNPEENARRFRSGWFHTGDLAVVDAEGYLTIVDRKDDVIITGGENVYSVEVEDALYSHAGILEAAVIGLPDPVWGERVTAVVVPRKGCRLDEGEVIDHCRRKLAVFKAPKRVLFAKNLPKTGSAKIYKYRLREKYKDEQE